MAQRAAEEIENRLLGRKQPQFFDSCLWRGWLHFQPFPGHEASLAAVLIPRSSRGALLERRIPGDGAGLVHPQNPMQDPLGAAKGRQRPELTRGWGQPAGGTGIGVLGSAGDKQPSCGHIYELCLKGLRRDVCSSCVPGRSWQGGLSVPTAVALSTTSPPPALVNSAAGCRGQLGTGSRSPCGLRVCDRSSSVVGLLIAR